MSNSFLNQRNMNLFPVAIFLKLTLVNTIELNWFHDLWGYVLCVNMRLSQVSLFLSAGLAANPFFKIRDIFNM